MLWLGRIATDPMVLLLLGAAAAYLWLGETTDAYAALAAVAPIALLDVLLELRTERALDQLRKLSAPTARALRDGAFTTIPSEAVVPGDVLELREGDVIAADGRLTRSTQMHVDESPLTGESEACAKSPAGDANVFAGTRVLSGRAEMAVTATGMRSRYGEVARLLASARAPQTPLQRVIKRLFLGLTIVAAAVCVGVFAIAVARGARADEAIIPAIGLAMAAIPEEIPVVATLYLGLGAWRLARDRALIRRLSGVETLGLTTVICTDKTGTLTEGRIRVADLIPAAGADVARLLEGAALASEPEPFDPIERAIAAACAARGVDPCAAAGSLVRDHPFDPRGKYVSHVWSGPRGTTTYAKGSPETIVDLSTPAGPMREGALAAAAELANGGYRVIGVAAGPAALPDEGRSVDERALRFLGLIAFADPLRPDAREAIAACRRAGVRVILVTGDHPGTARAVATAIGLSASDPCVTTGDALDRADQEELGAILRTTNVFARTRPEQKLRIVKALRAHGEVVAVTGDGINDGPALREAHIGVAMGASGTSVAREAATLVLLDDDFMTIVRSIRDGRRIFDNLGRAVSYLIAFHIPLILVALVLPLLGAPLLLLPLHLVWLEVIVHPTASLVFEADPAAADLMSRPPRSAQALLPSVGETVLALVRGAGLTLGVLALYLSALGRGPEAARALGITALIVGQVLMVVTARAGGDPLWRVSLRNPVLPFVVGLSIASVAAIPAFAGSAALFHMRPLDGADWLLAAAVAAVAVLGPELLKLGRAVRPWSSSPRRGRIAAHRREVPSR